MDRAALRERISGHLRGRAMEVQTALESVLLPEEREAAIAAYPAWVATHINFLAGQPNQVSEWLGRMVPWARAHGVDLATMISRMARVRDSLVALCADLPGVTEADVLRVWVDLEQEYLLKLGAFYVDSERETLLAERRKLHAAGEAMSEAIALLDLEGEVLFINRAASEILGEPASGLVGQSLLARLPESIAGEIRRALRQKRGPHGRVFSATVDLPGALRVPVEFTAQAVYDAQGRRDGVALVMRPQQQAARAESADPVLALVSQHLGLAIQHVGLRGQALESALLPALPWAEPLRAKEALCRQLSGCAEPGGSGCRCAEARSTQSAIREHVPGTGNASGFVLCMLLVPLSGGSTFCVVYDATQRKALETQVLSQQRNSLATQLAVAVAHQLRNPLGVIIGSAELLRGGLSPEQTRAALDRLLRNSLRCKEIVSDMAEFARASPEELMPCDVRRLIIEQVRPYYSDAGECTFTWSLPPGEWVIRCAPEPFGQVIGQLLDNALQAGASEIAVLLEDMENSRLRLSITDNGPGIAPEDRPHIFQPFYSTHRPEGALGLGLSLAGAVVQDLGGRIYLDPHHEPGARFVLEMPRIAEPARPPVEASGEGRRILLVDDEIDLLEIMEAALSEHRFTIDAVATGEEAVALLERRSYRAVVMDVQLPGVIQGPQIYAELRRLQPGAIDRCMFVTADTMNFETRRFLEETGRPYLEKPFLVSHFVRKVVDLAADAPGRGSASAERRGGRE